MKAGMYKKVYELDSKIIKNYNGCGYALGCLKNNKIIKIEYLRNLGIEDIDDNFESFSIENIFYKIRKNEECKKLAHSYEKTGEFLLGMVSCWEFISF